MSDLPNIAGEVLAVDLETRDPDLVENGPGWGRGYGNIAGIALAVMDGPSFYLPIAHEVETEANLPVEGVKRYVSDMLDTDQLKFGANCMYDYGWLLYEGFKIGPGQWCDVQFAEALIEPNAKSFSLETLAQKYLKRGKVGSEIYQWCANQYRGQPTAKDQGGNIHRCPARIVAPYAEEDARLCIDIYRYQIPRLDDAELMDLFDFECQLIPLLVKMRLHGMNVDYYRAREADEELKTIEILKRKQLTDIAGKPINVNSSKELAVLYDKLGKEYPKTAKGNPSFTADWLKEQHSVEATLINDIRKISKARETFINGTIFEKQIDKKIYPSLHPLRSDDGGTITGRFSCSKPNAQQIPSRDDYLAPIIRSIFIPDKDHEWCKFDYSQIEYRMFAHFCDDRNVKEAYKDPKTDFHELVGGFLGGTIARGYVKNINFAKLYGASNAKILSMLRAYDSNTDVEEFVKIYERKFPAVKRLTDQIMRSVEIKGEIRTLLNRRTKFDLWVSKRNAFSMPVPYNQALNMYRGVDNIERANKYKAVNYLLQGSAADFMKKGMLDAYNSGIFDRVGYPHISVHDEIDMSYHPDYRKEFIELKKIMENAFQLTVPIIMDVEMGPNWGDVKEFDLEKEEYV